MQQEVGIRDIYASGESVVKDPVNSIRLRKDQRRVNKESHQLPRFCLNPPIICGTKETGRMNFADNLRGEEFFGWEVLFSLITKALKMNTPH